MKKSFAFLIFIFLISCNKSSEKKDKIDITSKEEKETLFTLRDSKYTNLTFENNVIETFDENYLNYEFIYNGSGVAVGDLNNDGLTDIYFAGNSVGDKLYINEGNLKFKDISKSSGISNYAGWSTGVTMIDVNSDGWLDIYVCRSGPSKKLENRTNRLFINNKDNTFTENADKYGLRNTNYSIQSAFFDYDLDGDLDMYLLNHPKPGFKGRKAQEHMADIKSGKIHSDQFFENINGKYIDKTKEAKLTNFGYRLGIAVGDINNDGYPDLYVSSDYEEPDVLCINQGNKTFKNEINSQIKHISLSAMGVDMADVNNDGLLDVFVVEMAPSDHFRSKAYMKSMNVEKFTGLQKYGYHSQYMSNTFQLNKGNNTFSEVALYSHTAKTDWSWSPLFFDMDLDGNKDLFITNGIKENFLFRDIQTEVNKKTSQGGQIGLKDLLEIVPSDISENIFYRNNGDASFKNMSGKWAAPSLYNSNGIATSDFDNDGDLDFVTNNMLNNATLYENLAANNKKKNSLKIVLKGTKKNLQAIGAKIEITTKNGSQWQELYTTRGYLSSVDPIIIFGLNNEKTADVKITWPDGLITSLPSLAANKKHIIAYDKADKGNNKDKVVQNTFVKKASKSIIKFKHQEDDFFSYGEQILLPHSQSNVGPTITKGDVNGDGLEDIFIGGAAGQSGKLFIQNNNGKFSSKNGAWQQDKLAEDTGSLLFDSDADGDLDLYIVSGGAQFKPNNSLFQDRLYINDGKGNFVKSKNKLPKLTISGQTVISSDIDKDGDLDLFVGGRLIPDKYPSPPKSYLLINDKGSFSQKEINVNQMVSDALFTDYDGDGDEDILTVGEWSNIKVFNNNNGDFSEANIPSLKNTTGLWFGLEQTDIDNDGDLDYFIGNLGLNNKFKNSKKKEFHIYAYDFDTNGTFDIVLSGKYKGKLVPSRGRECSSDQMPFIKNKFKDYRSFANACLDDIYGDNLKKALHYQVNFLYSVYLENLGDGKFNIKKLPWQAQLAPIFDFEFIDIDNDGKNEIITVGNLYDVEVETVRYDASIGNVFSFENGNFNFIDNSKTGFRTTGDSRNICTVNNNNKEKIIIVTNNNSDLDVFSIPNK